MLKEKIYKEFLEKEYHQRLHKALNDFIQYVRNNPGSIMDSVKQSITSAFDEIASLQANEELVETGYIIFTMLRTELSVKNYVYKIKVYNDLWYLDPNHKDVGSIDVSWCYSFVEHLWDELYAAKGKYPNILTGSDIDNTFQIACDQFDPYVAYIFEMALRDLDMPALLDKINCTPDIKILSGEYFDKAVYIYPFDYNELELG